MLSTLLMLAQTSWAQTADVDRYKPPSDAYGYGVTESAETLGHLQLGVGVYANYANDPVVLVDSQGDRVSMVKGGEYGGPLESRFVANAHVGMGLAGIFSLSADLPVVLAQTGYALDGNPLGAPPAIRSSGLGDLRLTPKIAPVSRDEFPLGVALSLPISVPTGADEAYLSSGGASVSPTFAVEFSDDSVWSRDYTWRAALNLGFHVQSPGRVNDLALGSGLIYRAAFGFRPTPPLELMLDVHGQSWGASLAQSPLESDLSGRVFIGDWMSATAGFGLGVLPGMGSPDYRVFVGFTAAPSFDANARDTDVDGVPDGSDRCPKHAEDQDGYQDEDGCPELDNDGDGVEDEVDKCPNDPEDDDGFRDNDGCPEMDNDNDGLEDLVDRCPDEAETMNGFQDEDGCPDVADTDGDGFNDDVDRCPYDAEDLDGNEDNDGCPEEEYVAPEPTEPERVVIKEGRIQINEKVFFETGKTIIKPESYDLLNEVAQVLIDNPNLLIIRVEGHTDSQGSEMANLTLSKGRAESVKTYLVKQGVEAGRLQAVGLGESSPIDTNDTEDGRSNNRRVEFVIVKEDRSEFEN